MYLGDWVTYAERRLREAGVESPRLEAMLLLGGALRRDRAYLIAHPFEEIEPMRVEPLLERRLQREPLAYILGTAEFYGRPFHVDPRVLIPRPETESLIEAALELVPAAGSTKILDLGTGSGCIAVTLKLERPQWDVWAADISSDALEVARRNAGELAADVQFQHSDLFEAMPQTQFHAIVTNPPYVRAGDTLQPEVGDWEPKEALFAGHDGLQTYWRIAATSAEHLVPTGILLTEVGDGMAESVAEVFADSGWSEVARRKDLLGHERVLVFRPGV